MSDPQPLIRVDDVVKHFPLNDKVFGSSGRDPRGRRRDRSSSTRARCSASSASRGAASRPSRTSIMKLEEPTSGTIEYLGT